MTTTATFYGSYDYWELRHKVTFDGPNKLIIVNEGETSIDVGIELYSDWKEWSQLRDNLKFDAAMRSVGGDPLTGGDELGATFFLINGWRILVRDEVDFVGNLFEEGGASPFITESGAFVVTSRVSNLIDKPALTGVSANARVFV